MERWDNKPFQQHDTHDEPGWNVVELESRIHIRSKILELIEIAQYSQLTRTQIHAQLRQCHEHFGLPFSLQLVRTLQSADAHERETIIWLLVTLNDQSTIPHLQKLAQQTHISRSVRFSASLALAGMGATTEMTTTPRPRLYAIS